MISGQHFVSAKIQPLPAKLRNAAVRLQQRLRSGRSEADNHFRLQRIQLPEQKWRTFFDFVRLGLAISRRTALHHIADVDILTLQAHGFNHLRQKFSRASDKWQSLFVFVRAGTFAHEYQLGLRASIAKHNLVARRMQFAARAFAKILADFQQRVAGDL